MTGVALKQLVLSLRLGKPRRHVGDQQGAASNIRGDHEVVTKAEAEERRSTDVMTESAAQPAVEQPHADEDPATPAADGEAQVNDNGGAPGSGPTAPVDGVAEPKSEPERELPIDSIDSLTRDLGLPSWGYVVGGATSTAEDVPTTAEEIEKKLAAPDIADALDRIAGRTPSR